MADIRIKDLATTATTSASDDYLALDGSTNGTRKILATNVANNVTDVVFGASGPSAKSSIAARAARQGLVFDGTAGAIITAQPTIGTTDFTISVTAKQVAAAGAYVIDTNPSNVGIFYFAADGSVAFYVSAVIQVTSAAGVIEYGKYSTYTVTRTGGTTTLYKNGISIASTALAASITSPFYTLGKQTGGDNKLIGSIYGPYIYNRALSAAEVVSLYEAGVPAGADYAKQIAGTALITGNSSTFASGVGSWVVQGAASIANTTNKMSVTGVASATDGTKISVFATSSPYKYRLSVTISNLVGGTTIGVLDQGANQVGSLVSGANILEFTNSNGGGTNLFLVRGSSGAVTSFDVSAVTLVPLGLLLAPDAAQSGGGLTWYDTSGNAANITLPATGVTWNVPTSGKAFSLSLASSTASTNTTSGALVVTGGVGVGGAMNVGGGISSPGSGTASERFGASASTSTFTNATAVGSSSSVTGSFGTAIGNSSTAADSAVAIGLSASASSTYAIAIGRAASAANFNSIALGAFTSAPSFGIAIGYSQTAAVGDIVLGIGNSASEVYVGQGKTAAADYGTRIQPASGSGAGVLGGTLRIAGGKGGDAATAGGSVIIQTAAAGTGTTLTDRLTISPTGAATFAGAVTVGGSGGLTLSSGSANLVIQSGTGLFLDGGGNTYIVENAPDSIQLKTGGLTALTATATLTTFAGAVTVGGVHTISSAAPYQLLTATTGTNYAYTEYVNTGNNLRIGLENSSGASIVPGAPAYSAFVASVGARSLVFATNNIVRQTIDSTGAATFAGAVTVSSSTASTNTTSGALVVTGGVGVGGNVVAGGFTFGTAPNASYPFYAAGSTAGTPVSMRISHSDGTNATSNARIILDTASGGGDPFINFISGAVEWSLGVDNSASDVFKLSRSGAIGTTDALTIDGSNAATFAGAVAIGNTVNTVSPTSPNRTVTMVIGGVTYYLAAKTTND